VEAFLRCIILLLAAASLATAQTPAGGKWMLTVVTDKMTDARTEQFYLSADSAIVDSGIASTPTLNLLCSGSGRFNGAQLQTGVVLAVPDHPTSHLYPVRVRLDSKQSTMFWNRFADSKTLGLLDSGFLGNKHEIAKLLKASDLRIQLPTFSGDSVVAQFSPAGLNREMLLKSCGLKP
jgi:hypothetical protein